MLTQRVRLEGPIFRGSSSKNALRKARESTMQFGVKQIASWTPVRTSRLKKGWRYESDSIINEVPYANYVELGTRNFEGFFMVRDSLPAIEEYYAGQVRKYLRSEGLID